MKKKIFLWGVVIIGFTLLGVFAGLQRWQTAPPEQHAAPQFFSQDFQDLQGEKQSMAPFKGKALVVNFWATWCSPCVEEMPELQELQEELKGQNTQVIGLGVDSAEKMREFAQTHHITYPLYEVGMPGIELSRQFGNQAGGLPFTVLIDADGKTRKTYLGRLKMDELRRDIAAL